MSQFDATTLPEGQLALKFVMCDNYFHGAFGGSFLNHQYLVAAQAPNFQSAASSFPALLQPSTGNSLNGNDGFDANKNPTPVKQSLGQSANTDNQVTTDGFAVNTLYTVNTPHPIGTAAGRYDPQPDLSAHPRRPARREKAKRGPGISGWLERCAGGQRPIPTFNSIISRSPSSCRRGRRHYCQIRAPQG